MAGDKGTIEVARVLGGRYAVMVRSSERSGWDTERVPGDGDDRERWAAARERFEKDLADAEAAFHAPVERPLWRQGRLSRVRWLPGYRAEQVARASARAALRTRAEERYRPVLEEILGRVTVVRAERERAERAAREHQERLDDVVRREVWCWIRKGRQVAVVFRHDVAAARLMGKDTTARGPIRLDVLGDELYKWGMTTVRWEPTTKQAVAADCAEAGEPLTFAEWWAAAGPWDKPHRGPTSWCTNRAPWPVPTRRSRERLHSGTSHHSSYGVGDSGFGSF